MAIIYLPGPLSNLISFSLKNTVSQRGAVRLLVRIFDGLDAVTDL